MKKTRLRLLALTVVQFLLVLGFFIVFVWSLKQVVTARSEQFLTFDFLAYHASVELFLSGENPYNPERALELQQGVAAASIQHWLPARSWYPPWSYPLLSLVFRYQHKMAASLWFAINIVLLLLVAVLGWRIYGAAKSPPATMLFLSILFFPVKEVFAWGQVGLLLTFGVLGFMYCVKQQRDVLAGCSLLLVSIKPQLSFLIIPAVLYWIYREKRYRVLAGLAGAGVISSALALYLVPTIFIDWFVALRDAPKVLHTPTLAGWLRYGFGGMEGAPADWPLYAMPATGLVLTSAWLLRRKAAIDWNQVMPIILCMTLFSAPYANVHDFVLLLLLQIGAFAASRDWFVAGSFLLLQLATVLFSAFFTDAIAPFVWFPYAMLLLWLWSLSRLPSQKPA